MKITQIYELVNSTTAEVLGTEGILLEDLSNVVDVGNEIISSDNVDNYVKKLVNHIGKVIFDNRVYSGSAPSVLMDSWEFGSILEKITADIPEASENESWMLEDGKSYDQDVFYQPTVSAKFFNSKVTFEVPLSFTERQVKESFSNATQLNGFLSMLYNAVDKSLTIKNDNLIMRTINNMIAETLLAELGTETEGAVELDTTGGGVKAINLLATYNTKFEQTLTPENALFDKDFIRYATHIMNTYKDRISKISTLFNVGGKARFTPASDLHVVILSELASVSDTYFNSDVVNNDLTKLPNYETVPYWQGSGLAYDLEDISKISVEVSHTLENGNTGKVEVTVDGILGVMFDKHALGVANLDKRVTSNYNAKAEFFNNYYKVDAGYYNDLNENFIVFFMG